MKSVIKSNEIQNKARCLMVQQRAKIKNYKQVLNVLAFHSLTSYKDLL